MKQRHFVVVAVFTVAALPALGQVNFNPTVHGTAGVAIHYLEETGKPKREGYPLVDESGARFFLTCTNLRLTIPANAKLRPTTLTQCSGNSSPFAFEAIVSPNTGVATAATPSGPVSVALPKNWSDATSPTDVLVIRPRGSGIEVLGKKLDRN